MEKDYKNNDVLFILIIIDLALSIISLAFEVLNK